MGSWQDISRLTHQHLSTPSASSISTGKSKKLALERDHGHIASRTVAPKDVPFLIPRTWGYVTLNGKRHFADTIKNFEMGKLSWII